MSRAGRKAFARCDVKEIELTYYAYEDGTAGPVRPLKTFPKGEAYHVAGAIAILHCPRTESPLVNIESEAKEKMLKTDAYKSLKELAGELLCRDCRFSTMTPVQVSIARKEFDIAEAKRIEAHQLLLEARAELDAIDSTLGPS